MKNKEKRFSFSPSANDSFRAQVTGEAESRHIKGTGIVFNQRSKIITEWCNEAEEVRSFFEIIDPTALDLILNNGSDVVLDVNHNFDELLARISSGTLTLSKDEIGVHYEFDAPETARGEDVLQMIRRGDYYESSFMFTVGEDKWELDNETGLWIRTILRIDALWDMAICTYRGAYNNTAIENERVLEYTKEDLEVVSRKLDELMLPIEEAVETKEEPIINKERKYNEDFITRVYLKRNWERKKKF